VAAARTQNRLQDLYLRLVEVVDNLERALAYSDDEDPLAPGVRATREQLLDVLRRRESRRQLARALFDQAGSSRPREACDRRADSSAVQRGVYVRGRVLRQRGWQSCSRPQS
jgi:hypothetical protein